MENIIDYEKIGSRIREARIKKALTQEQLAELTELSTSHISHIESGSTKIGLPALVRVSNVLTVSVDFLLQDNSEVRFNAYAEYLMKIIDNSNSKEQKALTDVATIIHGIFEENKE